MFALLNYLQYTLQKPWRFLLKKPTSDTVANSMLVKFFSFLVRVYLYFLLLPLRYFNALYYNIWVYGLWNIRDHFGDVFNPKVGGMRHRKGFSYAVHWLVGFPFRFMKHYFIAIIQLMEGLLFVYIDTIFPALTMYHGTHRTSCIDITKPGKWRVGDGNYAGSGLYFTMDKKTAIHYANQKGEPTIICARVTLGRTINLNTAPSNIRQHITTSGDEITRRGREQGYTAVEWWRQSPGWWEYCLLYERDGNYIKTWRIRILYAYNLHTKKKEHIWGGKALWLL